MEGSDNRKEKSFPHAPRERKNKNFLKGKMTMNKRILSIILVLTMLIGVVAVMPITATASNNTEVWDGETIATSFAGGDGSKNNPYKISNGAELAYLSQEANKGNTFNGKYFELTNDIVLNEGNAADWGTTAPANQFTPIGVWTTGFQGNFDGKGYTISGLYQSGNANMGLFGNIGGGAVIANFSLVNSYINAGSNGESGAIVGQTDRSNEDEVLISNIYTDAIIVASKSKNSDWVKVGGIIGNITPADDTKTPNNPCTLVTIDRATFAGTITTKGKATGGIVGDAQTVDTVVTNCLYVGTINRNGQLCGGMVGNSAAAGYLLVENCISAGAIDGSGSYAYAFFSSSSSSTSNDKELLNSYFIGDNSAARKTTTNTSEQLDNFGKLYDETILDSEKGWDNWVTLENDIVRPAGVAANVEISPKLSGEGTPGDPYTISTAKELAIMSKLCQSKSYEGEYFELTADITLTGENNHTPIGTWGVAFGGKFDGKGHTISGMHIDSTADSKALFGVIQGGAEIRNLALVDAYVKGGAGGNDGCTAALVGQTNRGSSEEIIIDNIYIDAQVIGNGKGVAGVLGNNSNAKDSYTPADVTITNVVVNGSITSNNEYVAGFVGTARDAFITLENCANYATVTSSKSRVAGLIAGETGGYSISNCISAGRLTGSATVFAVAYHSSDAAGEAERVINNAYVVDGIAAGGSSSGADAGAVIVTLDEITDLIGAGATIPEGFTARTGDVALPAKVAANLNTTVIYGFGLLDGASIRISEPSGLRFTAVLGADYLASLNGNVSYGIIIAPTDYVKAAGEFTIEALEGLTVTGGSKYKVIPAEYCSNNPEVDGYYEFSAVLAPIQATNYDRAFSARAYVKVDGVYYYSEYDEDLNSRSVSEVADKAYNDLSVGMTEKYSFMVVEDIYSPYDSESRDIILSFTGKKAVDIYALSYNIRAAQDETGYEKEGREDDVVSYLVNSGADIIGLQEVNVRKSDSWLGNIFGMSDFNWLDELSALESAGYTCYTGKNLYPSSESQERYLPIYYNSSKFEFVSGDTKWLTSTPDTISKLSAAETNQDGYRGVTYVILRDKETGAKFVYANVHNSPRIDGNTEGMMQQIVYLRQILESITEEYDAMFIGGDNNYGHTNIEKFYNKYVIEDSLAVEKDEVVASTEIISIRKANPLYNNENEIKGSGAPDFNAIGTSIIDNFFIADTGNVSAYSYKLVDNRVEGKSYNYPSDHIPVKMYVTIYVD